MEYISIFNIIYFSFPFLQLWFNKRCNYYANVLEVLRMYELHNMEQRKTLEMQNCVRGIIYLVMS